MILTDFIVPSRANARWLYSGIDSPGQALDKNHFDNFKYFVEYQYNSRGYRDQEWPKNLSDVIWCIGDSFTVGIGSPLNHTWPQILKLKTRKPIVNVSMDGGSNSWMSRKILRLFEVIKPKHLVVHWSYLHRREKDYCTVLNNHWQNFYNNVKDKTWPACPDLKDKSQLPTYILEELTTHSQSWQSSVSDEDLKLHYTRSSNKEDVELTIQNILTVENHKGSCDIIHSIIPDYAPEEYQQLFNSQLPTTIKFIPKFKKLDLARDGYHYDIDTATYFVDKITELL